MMKIKTAHWQWTVFLCVLLAVSVTFTGCATKAYTCEIVRGTDNTVYDQPEQLVRTVQINGNDFECTFSESTKSRATGKIRHEYLVKQPGENETGYVRFNESGYLEFFGDIRSFAPIENIETLSDSELKQVVEEKMGELADFSKHTEFSVKRIFNGKYDLTWQVKREILCGISVDISMDENGEIYYFKIANECADDLYKPFVTDEERDALIWEALNNRKSSIVPHSFTILSELLTMNEGKNAIAYTLRVTDAEGFCEVVLVMITET